MPYKPYRIICRGCPLWQLYATGASTARVRARRSGLKRTVKRSARQASKITFASAKGRPSKSRKRRGKTDQASPQGAADKDRLRSSVAPHSFPAYNSSGNCRPEPAWKTDAERLGSMRGGNRVTVAYPLMRTELPQSAPVIKICRISRISRNKPNRIFAVYDHCGNSTPRVRAPRGCERAGLD